MKRLLTNMLLLFTAIIIILATFFHGFIADISVFHGIILHPLFLLSGLCLLVYYKN